jgi:hypothetical protein
MALPNASVATAPLLQSRVAIAARCYYKILSCQRPYELTGSLARDVMPTEVGIHDFAA